MVPIQHKAIMTRSSNALFTKMLYVSRAAPMQRVCRLHALLMLLHRLSAMMLVKYTRHTASWTYVCQSLIKLTRIYRLSGHMFSAHLSKTPQWNRLRTLQTPGKLLHSASSQLYSLALFTSFSSVHSPSTWPGPSSS